MINDGGSGYVSSGDTFNGFTVTCDSSQANCGYKYDVGGDFEVTGTATISVDDISLSLEKSDKISFYEENLKKTKPWTN
jgi:hypothetical protein